MLSYDFFLAHAGPDATEANQLYDLLSTESEVFLDVRSLLLGDDWDQELAKAQRSSRVTVVLVSASTDAAFYQREEIAAAIDLARASATQHRVVPVYLDPASDGTPYGLRLKHGITIADDISLEQVAARLLDLHRELVARTSEPATTDATVPTPDAPRRGYLRSVGGGRPATASPSLNERRLQILEVALRRVVSTIFRDPRITVERLNKANTALLSIGPFIAAMGAAARQESRQPMRYELQQLDNALRKRQTAVSQKLAALGKVNSEEKASPLCDDLAKEATGLLEACAQAIPYVI